MPRQEREEDGNPPHKSSSPFSPSLLFQASLIKKERKAESGKKQERSLFEDLWREDRVPNRIGTVTSKRI